MKILILISAQILTITTIVNAQIPVTVSRSTINAGESVVLSFSAKSTIGLGQGEFTVSYTTGGFSGSGGVPQNNFTSVIGTSIGSPSTLTRTLPPNNGNIQSFDVSVFGNPVVTFDKAVPSAFTNSISGIAIWSSSRDYSATVQNTYAFTVIEEGSSPNADVALKGQVEFISSLSRNSIDTTQRKLLGFQLNSQSPSKLKSIAFLVSNTSSNSAPENNLTNLQLVQDVDGANEFDSADTILATTTNVNGYASFTNLNIPVGTTNLTLFLTASFNPSVQSKNSFISASLNPQNVLATTVDSEAPVKVVGSSVLGKQYAFLDSTTVEEDEQSSNLRTEIITSLQSEISHNNIISRDSDFEPLDSIIPACIAGAAGVAAAYTTDALNKDSKSSEFTTVEP